MCTCDIIIHLESILRHYRAEITMGCYLSDLIIMMSLLMVKTRNVCSQPESVCVCLSVMYVCPSQVIPPMTLMQGHNGSTDIQISVACSRQPGNKLATTVGNVSHNLELDFANVYIDYAFCSSSFGFRP